ncbi:ABC transporter ATP-binding protein [Candidatus Atribacteria bacterium HGW-Atribacteria-1]|nr:MAG: ABC transporter ATP-binding protein [Candidatus Atribacteria bacterium HGW-Atribacteria-1]
MSNVPILELNNIVAGYGKKEIINKISIRINQGRIVTLLGSNAVGKTTILKTILSQTYLKSGEIKYKGVDIAHLATYKIARLGISYVPEGRGIFANLTTKENLLAGAYLLKSKQELENNLNRVYSIFPILKERSNQLAESLSGGEQEMLVIGRSLMSKPNLLLLDEPSLGLAPKLVELIGKILREINNEGVCILLVEQNAKLALELADYGYLIRKGTIVLEGDTKDLIKNKKIKEIYLGIV